MSWTRVSTVAELNEALASGAKEIEISGTLKGMPSITLPQGVALRGGELVFGAKGLQLTSDNTIENLTVRTALHELAIYNDHTVEDLGTLRLRNIISYGQVYLSAEGSIRAGCSSESKPGGVRRRRSRPRPLTLLASQRQRSPSWLPVLSAKPVMLTILMPQTPESAKFRRRTGACHLA